MPGRSRPPVRARRRSGADRIRAERDRARDELAAPVAGERPGARSRGEGVRARPRERFTAETIGGAATAHRLRGRACTTRRWAACSPPTQPELRDGDGLALLLVPALDRQGVAT